MWNDSLQKGFLPSETSKGIISLIHKKKEKDLITNYRPITLLNIDYKIIAAAYAARLKKVISSLVGSNQRGFIPGRDIRVSILEAKLALSLSKQFNLNGAFIM
jgi:acyl CoA:acetate/3-ketoacid CoA transferase alpha subunit